MKRISIIVPAYNSHNTLARCLGSLVHQTLEDIEIIVVNDASTDDTLDIMKRCKAQFPDKVLIVDGKENRGSGGARNQGFDIASGEYIGLVDSDDYVVPEMFEKLYNKAREGDYDIVDCGYYSEAADKATIFTGDNVTGVLDDKKRSILVAGGGYLVTKIFKRELFNNPPTRMRENVRCLEDAEILIYMFLRARSIGNVMEVMYNYCDNENSATKTMDLDTYFQSIYGAMEATFDVVHDLPTFEGSRLAVEYALINLYSYGINRCLYDQIKKYNADKKQISRMYDSAGKKELQMFERIAALKAKTVVTDYSDNPDVVSRIPQIDIDIMRECDRRFSAR